MMPHLPPMARAVDRGDKVWHKLDSRKPLGTQRRRVLCGGMIKELGEGFCGSVGC